MKFISTQHAQAETSVSFIKAIFNGIAPDGGLYVPFEIPNLQSLFHSFTSDISFVEMSAKITQALFPKEFTFQESMQCCIDAFPFSPQLQEIDDKILLLELFHGPSCAFKDFGASYLATIMDKQLEKENRRIVILVATSGDTGSAVAQAFYKKKNIDVVILYPSKRVSKLQELQLCGLRENIYSCEVLGNFDDCQRMAKEAFMDSSFSTQYSLSSANSINIGRLIPQSFYYIYAWHQLQYRNDWLFCTPSGNFGNLTAGLLAMQWGLPVQHFITATNSNKVIPDYLSSGIFTPTRSVSTMANAMDVGNPSNFERMQYLFSHSVENMRNVLYATWVNDNTIANEIRSVYKRNNTFICPHTAAGTCGARKILQSLHRSQYKQAVVLATAHAGKFNDSIEKVTGVSPFLPKRLSQFLSAEKKSYVIDATLDALKKVFYAILYI